MVHEQVFMFASITTTFIHTYKLILFRFACYASVYSEFVGFVYARKLDLRGEVIPTSNHQPVNIYELWLPQRHGLPQLIVYMCVWYPSLSTLLTFDLQPISVEERREASGMITAVSDELVRRHATLTGVVLWTRVDQVDEWSCLRKLNARNQLRCVVAPYYMLFCRFKNSNSILFRNVFPQVRHPPLLHLRATWMALVDINVDGLPLPILEKRVCTSEYILDCIHCISSFFELVSHVGCCKT